MGFIFCTRWALSDEKFEDRLFSLTTAAYSGRILKKSGL